MSPDHDMLRRGAPMNAALFFIFLEVYIYIYLINVCFVLMLMTRRATARRHRQPLSNRIKDGDVGCIMTGHEGRGTGKQYRPDSVGFSKTVASYYLILIKVMVYLGRGAFLGGRAGDVRGGVEWCGVKRGAST